jgi:Uma2 family endonuclease
MAREKKPVPYAAIEELPDWKVGEIIDGELVVSPRPASRHALGRSALGADILGRFQFGRGGPGGWWILDEPELHFGHDVLVPDIAGWRRERMRSVPKVAFFTLAPDWICEVISPSTERIDRSKRLRIYAREGVKHAWLVNPLTRTLETLRLEGKKWLLLDTYANDALVRAEPFEAAEIDLLLLWGETRSG